MPPTQRHILYIEDDAALARLVEKDLGRRGHVVHAVMNGADGLQALSQGNFDAVALDHHLPGEEGLDILPKILALPDAPPVVYVTGADDGQTAVAALKRGAADYVIKQPIGGGFFELLYSALDAAIEQTELRRAKLRTEAALRENERRLLLALEAGALGTWEYDPVRRLLYGNERFWRQLGRAPVTQGVMLDVVLDMVHLEDRIGFELALAAQGTPIAECRVLKPDGIVDWVELRGQASPGGRRIAGISQDISLRKTAEEEQARFTELLERRVAEEMGARQLVQAELLQAQKMEAVGQLTGGVAHDFNNLLTVVMGNLELIQLRSKEESVGRAITGAMQAVDRAANLTRQLLAFSRKQHLTVQPVNVNSLIEKMDDLLARTIGPLVHIRRVLANDPWHAVADPSQLELAILNLAINGRDAMPVGGQLQILTADIGPEHPLRPAELGSEGDFVMVAVADTGIGMPEEVRTKVFEPFFTTKDVGRGSGLGLSMVYGFAKQSGGAVTVESEVGRGTAVRIFLPRATSVAQGAAEEIEVEPVELPVVQGRHILIVDDDAAVRELTNNALRGAGYEVSEAADGQAALMMIGQMATAQPGAREVDLLIADYAMPVMNGLETVMRARTLLPALKVIFVTGYVDADALDALPRGDIVLRKPFKLSDLLQTVAARLAEGVQPQRRDNVIPMTGARKG
ncbi:MAG TPA: response regulator [Stellaceae bacterium]|nr:response regulator [Stellaceae bacterium]